MGETSAKTIMWILPKQLISAFAADTEALTSDSAAASQACAQSLIRRSKPAQSSFYLREWKAGRLTRLRSGVISSPFLGGLFTAKWTSSLADIPASPLAVPANEPEKTIPGTSGLGSQMELLPCSPDSVSSKTSKGTFRWDSPQSLAIWKSWVTRCRGDYSRRAKLARHTSGDESFYLPTPCANEDSFRLNGGSQQSKCLEAKARRGELGEIGPLNPQFVEMMMGLSVGWTDSACLATESCQQLPKEHFKF